VLQEKEVKEVFKNLGKLPSGKGRGPVGSRGTSEVSEVFRGDRGNQGAGIKGA